MDDHLDKQFELAKRFYNLHLGPKLLILANVWDVGSAVIFERAGFAALGTTSAGIAYSLGYPDGERINLDDILDFERKIVNKVHIPLSVDIETGYGKTIDDVVATVKRVIGASAVGINLEDGQATDSLSLIDLREQCHRIEAIARLKTDFGVPFVINARTDAVWLEIGDHQAQMETAIRRANAYLEAGADCVFVPGALEPQSIKTLVQRIDGPLNVILTPNCPSVADLESLGVARLSLGSAPVRAVLGLTQRLALEIMEGGNLMGIFEHAIPYQSANELFGQ
jgi:2-methylisocitrate lyase-like PEP mutase family enzyme